MKNKTGPLKFSLYFFTLVYAFIVYGALIHGFYLEYQLNKFDIDGDGIFSGIEVTPEQEQAMQRVTSDTGRNFAPFTGLVFSLFLSLIFYISIKIYYFAKNIIKR